MVTELLFLLNEGLCSLELGTAYFNNIRNYVYSVTLADLLSKAVDLDSLAYTDLWHIFSRLIYEKMLPSLTSLHYIIYSFKTMS